MAVFAGITALSGFFAGGYLKKAGKYFAVFSGVFSGLLTLWMLFYVFLGRDFTAALLNKISVVLLYAFAGQKEMALDGSLAFETLELLPAVVFMFAVAGFFLNAAAIRFLLKSERVLQGKVSIIPAPVYLLAGSIAGRILFSNSFCSMVCKNVFIISVFVFFIAGMNILWLLLSRYNVPLFFKPGFMIFFVFAYPVPVVAGILNTWLDFNRKVKKGDEKNENNSC